MWMSGLANPSRGLGGSGSDRAWEGGWASVSPSPCAAGAAFASHGETAACCERIIVCLCVPPVRPCAVTATNTAVLVVGCCMQRTAQCTRTGCLQNAAQGEPDACLCLACGAYKYCSPRCRKKDKDFHMSSVCVCVYVCLHAARCVCACVRACVRACDEGVRTNDGVRMCAGALFWTPRVYVLCGAAHPLRSPRAPPSHPTEQSLLYAASRDAWTAGAPSAKYQRNG